MGSVCYAPTFSTNPCLKYSVSVSVLLNSLRVKLLTHEPEYRTERLITVLIKGDKKEKADEE